MTSLGKLAIAGVVLVVIGLVIMLTILGLNGWSLGEDYEMKNYNATTDITALNWDFEMGQLKTEFYDGDKIYIEYPENNRFKTTITENAGTMTISSDWKFKLINIGHWFKKMPNTILKVPNDSILNLEFNINAGQIDFASGNYGSVKVDMNAGTVNFENINCSNFDLKVNAGTLKVQNITTGNAKFDMNAGDIKIAKIVSSDIYYKVNAGNIIIKEVECPKFTAKLNAGGLEVERAVVDDLNLDVNAGKIKFKVVGNKADYNISVEKDGGSCNLSNQIGIVPQKKITLDIDAGSINIDFI